MLCISVWLYLLALYCCGQNVNPNITQVHMVIMNHFDCGFQAPGRIYSDEVSYAVDVINEYFDIYFPRAVSVGDTITHTYNLSFTWTTQSWLISLYMDCPPNMRLHCPSQSAINNFLYGVKQRYITWHAFPFNSQQQLYNPLMVEFGLKLSKDCSINYGSQISKVLSQRDVPGITKSIIPILKRNNISAISIGANDGSSPANVPRIFNWYNEKTNDSIITLYHPFGYGGIDLNSAVIIPNYNVSFVSAFKNDNKGPPTVEETLSYYQQLQITFPNANIFASTFTNYIDTLLQSSHIVNSLPIVTKEMGDTWAWGVPSDPWKAAAFGIAQTERSKCLYNNLCSLDSIAFYNFSRLLLKNGEHTWGGAITNFLSVVPDGDYYSWTNKQFHHRMNDQKNGNNSFTQYRYSWYEQRDIGLTYAMDALLLSNDSNDISLYKTITKEWNKIYLPKSPFYNDPIENYNVIKDLNQIFIVISKYNSIEYQLQFDNITGSLIRLYDMNNSVHYASNKYRLGEFIYQSINEADYMTYLQKYVPKNKHPKPYYNLAKIFIEMFGAAEHQYIQTKLINIYQNKHNVNKLILQLNFGGNQDHLKQFYGGMDNIYIEYDFNSTTNSIFNMKLTWINKTATRLPENIWFQFQPMNCSNYYVNKLSQEINMNDVMLNGAMHFTLSTGNVTCKLNNNKTFDIHSIDAVGVGFVPVNETEFQALPTPFNKIDMDKGMAFSLYNNLWGTNYIMWYPYDPNDANATYRFEVYFN